MIMDIVRTIKIKLNPDEATKSILVETMAAYTEAFNAVCQYAWDNQVFNGVELHKATYYDHRSLYQLPAQLTCSARAKATESLKSARALLKKKRTVSCPQSKRSPIRYDANSYSVWFDRQEISLSTKHGRVKVPFVLPDYYQEYATWKHTSADLIINRKGDVYLNVVMQTEMAQEPSTEDVLGVDLGIVNPAVDSDGNKYGSDHWQAVEKRIFELTKRLQSKGTKSAKRHLKNLSGRRNRFRKDCDHVLSKQIVKAAPVGSTIAMEDLTDIRKRVKVRKAQRRRVHGWSFAQLQMFVGYKAAMKSVAVAYIDPRYTSQKCSSCGHTAKNNRKDQATFVCKECHFECHADYNAAMNIRDNYLKSRAAVNQPIVSAPRG